MVLSELMNHGGWVHFEEMVRYLQGMGMQELFSVKFMKATPLEKDKWHYAIVRVNQVLERLRSLPRWLAKTDPKKWDQVVAYTTKEEKTE